jgi:hypothetical protein
MKANRSSPPECQRVGLGWMRLFAFRLSEIPAIKSVGFLLFGAHLVTMFRMQSAHWREIGEHQLSQGHLEGNWMIERGVTFSVCASEIERYFSANVRSEVSPPKKP